MSMIKGNSRVNMRNVSEIQQDETGFTRSQKDDEGRSLTEEYNEATFKPWRVFINHVDSYHGKKLANFLSDHLYVNPQSGGGKDFEEEEEVEDEMIEEAESVVEEENEKTHSKAIESRKYEVIGTASDSEYRRPEDVALIIRQPEDRDALLPELMKCGIIIYDITQEQSQVEEALWALNAIVKELEKMAEEAPKAFKRNEEVRYFVLLSTVMTWALTKPLSSEDPDIPFTEADYRKRKPHPNFKKHIQCEKEVVIVKKKKDLADKLKTVVVCCGITYGDEEGPLHYLFKMAWKNEEFLPIIGKGNNKIPLLHVRDLITVVFTILQNWPSLRYIVAVEQELTTQSAIVKAISKALATGKTRSIAKEEAFLLPEVTQRTYDLMTMNLNIDPVYIIDRISWHLEMPFRDSISEVVKEYKAARNLHPMKILVLGPPASGKTMVARYLAKHYDIHYVHVEMLIAETIKKLSNEIETLTRQQNEDFAEEETDEADDDMEEDEVVNVEELKEQLEEIETNLRENNGRLDDVTLNKVFLRKLQSKETSNQGYVLDGYPKTLEQAKALFGDVDADDPEEAEDEEVEEETETGKFLPELVVALEASDEFLIERIINRPEREIQGTHYTEEHMIRRLREYRERNTDENTPLQFFDEIEIHPLIIPIEDDVCPEMFPTIYRCLEKLGKPRNYGLTAEEMKEARKREEAEARAVEEAEKLQQQRELEERKRQREEKMMEWTNLMETLKEEEEERLCILGLPLRHYLVRYVLPTLTQGLIEVAKLKPEDPVDFLAEYLFKENPEGKIFEPDYTETMSMLLDSILKIQNDVLPPEEMSDELMASLKGETEPSADDEMIPCEADICKNRKTTPITTPSDICFDTCVDTGTPEWEGDYCSHKTDE